MARTTFRGGEAAPAEEKKVPASERAALVLAGVGGPGAFSAVRTVPAESLRLEVRGVGELRLPVAKTQAKQVCALSRPAHYGKGSETLLDTTVRDTWEVPKSRVKMDGRAWQATMRPVLERFRRNLGLPEGTRLRAAFHSMLVYAPGQFFLPHQDSETGDAMVGSLVVMLPTAAQGGTLEVTHLGETKRYRGSKTAVSCVAFFSDCRHQVTSVRNGYRVVLTYDLHLEGTGRDDAGRDPEVDEAQVEALSACLLEHFEIDDHRRLVYLLDHEYTQKGLSWGRLKGPDDGRAAVLRAVSERAGYEVVLALAEVHETWSAEEAWESRRHRYGSYRSWRGDWDDWSDDDDGREGGEPDDYVLDELIDDDVTIDAWLDTAGKIEPVAMRVRGGEVCSSTPSDDLEPYRQEYEGYMGNWGNTLDRWYHRGALVVWPRSWSFAVRTEASPAYGLDLLIDLGRRGEVAAAREAAATVAPFWARAVSVMEHAASGAAGAVGAGAGKAFLGKAMRAALALDDPGLATMLLGPFRLEQVGNGQAKALCDLVERYGEAWVAAMVGIWSGTGERLRWLARGPQRDVFVTALPGLLEVLVVQGEAGSLVAALLLDDAWTWAAGEIGDAREEPSPRRRVEALRALARPVAAVLAGASLLGAAEVRDDVVAALVDGEVRASALAVLREVPRPAWSAYGLDPVATACATGLEAVLARPVRAPDDWSIPAVPRCCDLCDVLGRFLADGSRTAHEWPSRKDRRAHVHAVIKSRELPVAHETRHKGSPHVLVLTKTDALFEREAEERRGAAFDLQWLAGHTGRGAHTTLTSNEQFERPASSLGLGTAVRQTGTIAGRFARPRKPPRLRV